MLLHTAQDLDLPDAQRAKVEKLGEDLGGAGPGKEIKELHNILITGAKSKLCSDATCWGKTFTIPAITASYDAIDKAMAARHDKEAEALDGLHAALEPAQRKALVAAVRAKQTERESHAAEREKKAGAVDWTKRRLEHLTKELDLDAAQQKSVGALLDKADHPTEASIVARREEGKKRLEALLTAFEGDAFDAKKADLGGPGKDLRERLEHNVQFLGQLLALLKPEQREKLAAGMEKHSAVRGEHGAEHSDERPYHPIFDDQLMEPEAPKP